MCADVEKKSASHGKLNAAGLESRSAEAGSMSVEPSTSIQEVAICELRSIAKLLEMISRRK